MSRATSDLMDQLHQLTAATLADLIKNGVKTVNKDGEEVTVPVSAAYIAAAIKFLKDNDVTADADSKRWTPLTDALANAPSFDAEDFDNPYPN